MPNQQIRILAILGAISIIGIVFIQGFTLVRAYSLEDEEFDQTVRSALYQVAEKIATINNSQLPKEKLVQRKASNNYAVNVNDVIDANILEDYLIQEFEERGITTDFQYSVFDCESQEMVYGNYCKMNDLEATKSESETLPRFDHLVYYFVVGFPSHKSYLLSSIGYHILYGIITFLSLIFFIYSMWIILQQKKLSDLQKDFINNMTHEFKTPISSIKIAANVLHNDRHVQGNERLKRYGQIIVDQNNRLNEQVEKVLNIARTERDSFKLNFESFNAIEILRHIVNAEDLKLESEQHGSISLNTNIEHWIIRADKLHFSNVIHNIIDNALKYCIDHPMINIHCSMEKDTLDIKIKDNGIGIKK